jgi:hypothetical protein
MNDTPNNIKSEISRISKELSRLNQDLQQERSDRKAENDRQQKQMEEVVGIIMDFGAASTLVTDYFIKLQGRYTNLVLAVQEAISDFNRFLRLPASSSELSRYWAAAWAALSAVLPMLRISSAWVQLEKAAEAEVKAANFVVKSTSLQTKLFTYAARGHNVADWINKENTLAARLRDLEVKMPKADQTKSPIRALMEENNAAHKALEHVVDAIWAEYKARLTYAITQTPYPKKESLEKIADRLLPKLTYVEKDEADQIERTYLDKILAQWVPDNAAIVTTHYRTGDGVSIQGLNDTQQDQIMAWFGPESNWSGGTIPVFPSVYYHLYRWHAPSRTEAPGLLFGSG